MTVAARPLAAAAAALLGAGVVAATPVTTAPSLSLPTVAAPEIALQASIIDILGFPVYQQAIANEVEFVAIRAAGLAQGGAGLVDSLLQLPGALITATQQTLSGNPLDGLTTIEDWVIGTGSATLVPPVLANIEVGQIQLAIQSALLLAQPTALVQLGSGLFTAFDTISRSFIIAGQNLVDAVLSLNIGNIIQAVVGGVGGVIDGFVTGGQAVIDGIAGAQDTLVAALQARPGPVIQPLAVQPAAAVSQGAASTASGSEAPAADAPDAPAALAPVRADLAEASVGTAPAAERSGELTSTGARATGAAAERRGVSATRSSSSEAGQSDDGSAKADSKRAASR